MHAQKMSFIGASVDYNSARFVIIGVAYDASSSFRPGARYAPRALREVSENFEEYLYEYDLDIKDARVHDLGTISHCTSGEDVVETVYTELLPIVRDKKVPILIGGEHTIAIGGYRAVRAVHKDAIAVVFDAHSDMRDEYLGDRYSHACTVRRMMEHGDVLCVGVRSFFGGEGEFEYYTSEDVMNNGIGAVLEKLEDFEKIYLSVDMDVIDPAYAPGVGNPEPYGIPPSLLREFILSVAEKIVAMDICEINPVYDNGITAILGAKIILDFIGAKCYGEMMRR
ncbi:MAG: agmatinase [Thermoplasmata archaeon]|nr:MAG: agmatinase [Thermoplasmata archaeon]